MALAAVHLLTSTLTYDLVLALAIFYRVYILIVIDNDYIRRRKVMFSLVTMSVCLFARYIAQKL